MNIERMDRQISLMREFLIADCEDAMVETHQELDEAVAHGNEWLRREMEQRLAHLRETLQQCRAEQPAA